MGGSPRASQAATATLAATRLQAVYRGHVTRQEVNRRREAQQSAAEQATAANVIQGLFRRRKANAYVAAIKEVAAEAREQG